MRCLKICAFCALIILLASGSIARSETIIQIRERSQLTRLVEFPFSVDEARIRIVRESYGKVLQVVSPRHPITLHIISGHVLAECILGHTIVANESLADRPESARVFTIAHELGHVMNSHWYQMDELFLRHLPGEFVRGKLPGVPAREFVRLSYRLEFEADAFAMETMRKLGYSQSGVIGALLSLGIDVASQTHPSTEGRINYLTSLKN